MSPRPRASAGFSMIELIVVTVLMATILLGLFSLQDALLQQRGRILRHILVRNQNDYARRVLTRELASATVLQEPLVNSQSNNLVGWKNLDPSAMYCSGTCCTAWNPQFDASLNPPSCPPSGAQLTASIPFWLPLVNTDPVEWFRFCYDSARQQLDYYHGTIGGVSCANFPTSVPCGTAVPATTCGVNYPLQVLAGFNSSQVILGQAIPSQALAFSRPTNNWIDLAFLVSAAGRIATTGQFETYTATSATGIQIQAGNQVISSW